MIVNKYKVLVHRETGQFGVFHNGEIWHCGIPDLFAETATMELLKSADVPIVDLKDMTDLDDYDLVDAELAVNFSAGTL